MLTILDGLFPEHISRKISSFIYLDEPNRDTWLSKYRECISSRSVMHGYLHIIRGLGEDYVSIVPHMKLRIKIVYTISACNGASLYPKIKTNMQTQIEKHINSFPKNSEHTNYWHHYDMKIHLNIHECIMIMRSYKLANISSGIHKYLLNKNSYAGYDGKFHPYNSCDICYRVADDINYVNGYYSPICTSCYLGIFVYKNTKINV